MHKVAKNVIVLLLLVVPLLVFLNPNNYHSISRDALFLVSVFGTLSTSLIMFIIAGKNPGNKNLLTVVAFLYLLINVVLPVILGPLYLKEHNKMDEIPWFYGLILMLRAAELFFARGLKTFLVLWKNPNNYTA